MTLADYAALFKVHSSKQLCGGLQQKAQLAVATSSRTALPGAAAAPAYHGTSNSRSSGLTGDISNWKEST
jgi:hypothetical protein